MEARMVSPTTLSPWSVRQHPRASTRSTGEYDFWFPPAWRRRMFARDTDDYREDRHVIGRNPQSPFDIRTVEPWSGEPDWAGPKPSAVCSQHEILSCKTAVLGGVQTQGPGTDNDKDAGPMEDVDVWICQHPPVTHKR